MKMINNQIIHQSLVDVANNVRPAAFTRADPKSAKDTDGFTEF